MSVSARSTAADRNALKRTPAEAEAELVQDGKVIGLGTGATAAFAVEGLARRYRSGLRFIGIPMSKRMEAQAAALGIPLTSFAEHRQIELTIDGADQVERDMLNLIKGFGGALLRERIVAAANRRLAVVVDRAKLVDRLGIEAPVPVEVVAFGLEATQAALEALGASSRLSLLNISSGPPASFSPLVATRIRLRCRSFKTIRWFRHSHLTLPIRRSIYGFCHGRRGAVTTSSTPIAITVERNDCPYAPSRSRRGRR